MAQENAYGGKVLLVRPVRPGSRVHRQDRVWAGGNMEFVAIDVETANADLSSICQIGVARFQGAEATTEWESYVDPEAHFDGMNVSIHGITHDMVRGAPRFRDLCRDLSARVGGRIVVCHTAFDRVAITRAFQKADAGEPGWRWLDTARVARRAWEEFAHSGYGLASVCEAIGYEYAAHDALEDAKAAAQVLLAAINRTGLGLEEWCKRVDQPIHPGQTKYAPVTREGNSAGPLFGEVVVFTGRLSITRNEAADMASRAGCAVADGVNKKTTILVVGDQDLDRLAGFEKSSKHRKAEEWMAKGHFIRIVGESDFQRIVDLSDCGARA